MINCTMLLRWYFSGRVFYPRGVMCVDALLLYPPPFAFSPQESWTTEYVDDEVAAGDPDCGSFVDAQHVIDCTMPLNIPLDGASCLRGRSSWLSVIIIFTNCRQQRRGRRLLEQSIQEAGWFCHFEHSSSGMFLSSCPGQWLTVFLWSVDNSVWRGQQ